MGRERAQRTQKRTVLDATEFTTGGTNEKGAACCGAFKHYDFGRRFAQTTSISGTGTMSCGLARR